MSKNPNKYWKENLTLVGALLTLWFVVTFLLAIIFADRLDAITFGGFKLGFWMAQQGAIYIYVLLIFVYIWLMEKLDRKYRYEEHEEKDRLHRRTEQ